VNVLRGPQGTLFGRNSEGGAILFRSVDPQGNDSGYFEAGAGNYATRRFRGAFDTSLIADTLYLRVAGGSETSNGYVTRLDYACLHPGTSGTILPLTSASNCKLGTEGGIDQTYGRIALKWFVSDNAIFNLEAITTRDKDEAVPEVPLIINPAYPRSDLTAFNNAVAIPVFGLPVTSQFIPRDPYKNYATFSNPAIGLTLSPQDPQQTWDVIGQLDWAIANGVKLTSISGLHELEGDISSQRTSPIPVNLNGNEIHYRSYSEEMRLSGGVQFQWTAGAYYFHGAGLQYGQVDLPATQIGKFYGANQLLISPTTDSDASFFLHLVYHITDQLSLEAGARYSHDIFHYVYGGENLPTVPVNPLKVPGTPVYGTNIPVESTTSRVDPTLALQYQWTEGFQTYARYSTGFKGAGTNPNPINAQQATPFGVESLKGYELGAKSDAFNHRMTVNADVYVNYVTGLQLLAFGATSAGGTTVQNAGKARIEGTELEVQARPTSKLLINLSGSFLHFRYTDLGAAAFSANNPGGLFFNDVAPYTPKWKGDFGVQYDIGLDGAGTLTPRLDVAYQSRIYFDPQNLLLSSQGGYAVLNGHLTWQHPGGRLSARLDADNVLNKLYYYSMFNQLSSYGTLTGQPAQPRSLLFSLKYTFR